MKICGALVLTRHHNPEDRKNLTSRIRNPYEKATLQSNSILRGYVTKQLGQNSNERHMKVGLLPSHPIDTVTYIRYIVPKRTEYLFR